VRANGPGQLALLIAVVAWALLTAGCSGTDDDGSPITFQTPFSRESKEFAQLKEMVELFHRRHPDVQVTLLPDGPTRQDFILRSILSGSAPDIIELPLRSLPGIASRSSLMDTADALADSAGRMFSSALAAAEYEGRLRAAPLRARSVQLIYNAEVLRNAGYRPEDPLLGNWTELLMTCDSVERYVDGCYAMSIAGREGEPLAALFAMLVAQAGGERARWSLKHERPEVAVKSDEGIEALDMFARLVGHMPPGVFDWTRDDLVREFGAGRVGMLYGDTSLLSEIKAAAPNVSVGVVRAPVKQYYGSCVEVYGAIVPGPARRRQACEQLLAFLCSRPAQRIVVTGGATGAPAFVSVRRDLLDAAWYEQHPEYKPFAEGLNRAVPLEPFPEWDELQRRVVIPELLRLARGEVTPEAAAETIRERGDLILVTYYRSLGHVEHTQKLAMGLLAVGVFFLVMLTVGHRSKDTPHEVSR